MKLPSLSGLYRWTPLCACIIVSCLVSQTETGTCNTYYYRTRQYQLCTTSIQRAQAQAECEKLNMTLAVILTEDEMLFWRTELAANYSKNEIWVGATYDDVLGYFVWDTGEEVNTTLNFQYPNGYDPSTYGCLRFFTNQNLQPLPCDNVRVYLCQEVLLEITTLIPEQTTDFTTQTFTTEPQETTTPDFTTEPDFTTTPDFTTEPDFTTTPDFTTEPDFTTTPDFTTEADFTTTPDFTTEPDFTTTPDFTTEPDFITTPDFTTQAEFTTTPDFTTELGLTTTPDFTTEVGFTTNNVDYTTEVGFTTSSELTTDDTTGPSNMCLCGCWSGEVPAAGEEREKFVTEVVEKIKKELYVNKETLSATVRKKTSAEDDRPSAKNVGYVGVAMLVTTGLLFVLSDMTYIWPLVQSIRHKCMSRGENS